MADNYHELNRSDLSLTAKLVRGTVMYSRKKIDYNKIRPNMIPKSSVNLGKKWIHHKVTGEEKLLPWREAADLTGFVYSINEETGIVTLTSSSRADSAEYVFGRSKEHKPPVKTSGCTRKIRSYLYRTPDGNIVEVQRDIFLLKKEMLKARGWKKIRKPNYDTVRERGENYRKWNRISDTPCEEKKWTWIANSERTFLVTKESAEERVNSGECIYGRRLRKVNSRNPVQTPAFQRRVRNKEGNLVFKEDLVSYQSHSVETYTEKLNTV